MVTPNGELSSTPPKDTTEDEMSTDSREEFEKWVSRTSYTSDWFKEGALAGWQACDKLRQVEIDRLRRHENARSFLMLDSELAFTKQMLSEAQVKNAELEAQVGKEKVRLDFVLNNSAFIMITLTDTGSKAFQLLTQNEDEDYIVLSGDNKFFTAERDAIDAALPQEGEKK